MSLFTIRPATNDDYAALCEVVAVTDRFHADLLPHRFQRIEGPARPRSWLEGLVGSPDGQLLVAEQGERLIGFLEGRVQPSPEGPLYVPVRRLKIEGIGVVEAHRGIGVGRALMEAAHAWARARGIHEVELSVFAANGDAFAFYERLGYATVIHRLMLRLE